MKVGHPLSPEGVYARELGIPRRRLMELGGMDRLKAMSEEARALMIAPRKGDYRELRAKGIAVDYVKGGLKAKGMKRSNVKKEGESA